jgi:elongation factor 1 alpha-like protein
MAAISRTATPKTGTPREGTPTKQTPTKKGQGSKLGAAASETSTPTRTGDQLSMDMHSMNLGELAGPSASTGEELPLPKISIAKEKVLEEARKATSGEGTKPVVSLVVIGENFVLGPQRFLLTLLPGHVDAGKSTMMGRLLYELGQIEEKKRNSNERNANKTGKASFSWAWEMDSGEEERERSARMQMYL